MKLSSQAEALLNVLKSNTNGITAEKLIEIIPNLEIRTKSLQELYDNKLADTTENNTIIATL